MAADRRRTLRISYCPVQTRALTALFSIRGKRGSCTVEEKSGLRDTPGPTAGRKPAGVTGCSGARTRAGKITDVLSEAKPRRRRLLIRFHARYCLRPWPPRAAGEGCRKFIRFPSPQTHGIHYKAGIPEKGDRSGSSSSWRAASSMSPRIAKCDLLRRTAACASPRSSGSPPVLVGSANRILRRKVDASRP
jgi:hypothetical protein